jgi:hypothetical protein
MWRSRPFQCKLSNQPSRVKENEDDESSRSRGNEHGAGLGPRFLFDIAVRIATDYLPHTLQSYLDVPTDEMPIHTGGGKTARDLTLEQLDLIGKALDEASDNHATVEANKLLANKRFLESRFGGSSLDIPK